MFTVYHISSTMEDSRYSQEWRARKKAEKLGPAYSYADSDYYHDNVVYMKTVKNILSGKDVQIPSNTPRCCDPSSELYHCM